jgi:hypothetical protein
MKVFNSIRRILPNFCQFSPMKTTNPDEGSLLESYCIFKRLGSEYNFGCLLMLLSAGQILTVGFTNEPVKLSYFYSIVFFNHFPQHLYLCVRYIQTRQISTFFCKRKQRTICELMTTTEVKVC